MSKVSKRSRPLHNNQCTKCAVMSTSIRSQFNLYELRELQLNLEFNCTHRHATTMKHRKLYSWIEPSESEIQISRNIYLTSKAVTIRLGLVDSITEDEKVAQVQIGQEKIEKSTCRKKVRVLYWLHTKIRAMYLSWAWINTTKD